MPASSAHSRREFLARTSCFGAAWAVAQLIPLPALAESLAQDPRLTQPPLDDRGFASIRQIGTGVYATISDPSKGMETLCNGGFLVGRDACLLIEGFRSPAGAGFQFETLRKIAKAPVHAALDSHYHFDHSMGNAFYGGQSIPVWAHAKVPALMMQNYVPMQSLDRVTVVTPYENPVRNAKTDVERQRADSDLKAISGIYDTARSTVIALPNRPLDPAKLPEKVDLGGLTAVIETYPGHTPGDVIVRVPEQNIVFTGDLLFNAWYPVTFDASISAWRETLGKFAAFGKDTLFVPGHGQLCGQEGIAASRSCFDDMAEQAEKLFKAGVPAAEAVQRYVVPEKFKGWPIFAWGFTIGPTISKLYEEWGAKK
jgi:glyoxylase-like metal-dependent hydrolase (beta-lactamase superfamily II)